MLPPVSRVCLGCLWAGQDTAAREAYLRRRLAECTAAAAASQAGAADKGRQGALFARLNVTRHVARGRKGS